MEDIIDTMWIYLLIAFIAGEALGLIVAAIISGWYDKAMEIKSRRRGNADGSLERSSRE